MFCVYMKFDILKRAGTGGWASRRADELGGRAGGQTGTRLRVEVRTCGRAERRQLELAGGPVSRRADGGKAEQAEACGRTDEVTGGREDGWASGWLEVRSEGPADRRTGSRPGGPRMLPPRE